MKRVKAWLAKVWSNRVVASFVRAFAGVLLAYLTGILSGDQNVALKAAVVAAIVAGLRAVEHLATGNGIRPGAAAK